MTRYPPYTEQDHQVHLAQESDGRHEKAHHPEDVLLLRAQHVVGLAELPDFILLARKRFDDGDAPDVLRQPLDHVVRQIAILAIAGLDDAREAGGATQSSGVVARQASVSGTWMQNM